MVVNVEQALGIVGQLLFIVGAVVGGILWLKKWIKSQVADPATATAENAKKAADAGDEIVQRIGQLERRVEDVAQRAHEAYALAAIASKRVDDFLYRALPRQETPHHD